MPDQVAASVAPAPAQTPVAQDVVATVPGTDHQAHPEAPGKIDLKAFIAQRYNEKHKISRGGATAAPAPTAPTTPPAAKTSEQVAPVTEPPKAAEATSQTQSIPPKEEPAKTSAEDDEIAARLARLANASNEAARQRKLRERERAAEERERAASIAHSKEIDLAKRLEAAKTKGSKIAVLEAAGYSREEIANSGWVVDLLNELGEGEAPKPLTEADVERKIAERMKAAEDERRAAEERERERKAAENAAAMENFYARVKVEYKAGDYPILRAQKVTPRQLDGFYQEHLKSHPGQFLTEKELLDHAETAVRAGIKAEKERLAKLEEIISPKPKEEKKPLPPAAIRTVTPALTADAGDKVNVEAPKRETLRDKEKRLRATVEAQYAARAAK